MKLRGRHSRIFVRNDTLVKKFSLQLAFNFWKEAYFLSLLQPYLFVPKVYSINPQKLEIEMEFLNGRYILDYLNSIVDEQKRKDVLTECLKRCYLLDKLGIRKEEMIHPDRHIVVVNAKPYFIDFERAHFVGLNKNAGNLTQFVTYLTRVTNRCNSIDVSIPKIDGLIDVLKEYKRNANNKTFKKVLIALQLC